MTVKKKCDICGLFDASRKCLNCNTEVCSADTCVVAYMLGGPANEDKVVCINCG